MDDDTKKLKSEDLLTDLLSKIVEMMIKNTNYIKSLADIADKLNEQMRHNHHRINTIQAYIESIRIFPEEYKTALTGD